MGWVVIAQYQQIQMIQEYEPFDFSPCFHCECNFRTACPPPNCDFSGSLLGSQDLHKPIRKPSAKKHAETCFASMQDALLNLGVLQL